MIRIDLDAGEVRRLGLTLHNQSLSGRFGKLICGAAFQAGQRAAVLVDEYDKPILDNFADRGTAAVMRDTLRSFYSVLKSADADLDFVLLTGVSKFSKVSLFSGLNQLQDITLDARWSALCGYTDEDIDTVFAPELPGLDRDEIRRWYNGYNWFETGTLSFWVRLLAERKVFLPRLQALHTNVALLSSFDVDRIAPEVLLFQAGYLTIHDVRQPVLGRWMYTLGYPNREVEASLNEVFLFEFKVVDRQATGEALRQIKDRGYADKYRARGDPIHLVGIEFGRVERNVIGFEVETIAAV